jgi:hypothetical protein
MLDGANEAMTEMRTRLIIDPPVPLPAPRQAQASGTCDDLGRGESLPTTPFGDRPHRLKHRNTYKWIENESTTPAQGKETENTK